MPVGERSLIELTIFERIGFSSTFFSGKPFIESQRIQDNLLKFGFVQESVINHRPRLK